MSETQSGGCLCGQIRYRVQGSLDKIIACHCVNCRKASGAACSHNMVLRTDQLTLEQGEPRVYEDTAASGNRLYRYFCGDCGSALFSRRAQVPEMTVLKAGSLDDSSQAHIAMNIWTDSAVPWAHLDPNVEAHPTNRPVPRAS